MRRREFITLLGSAAAAWPLAARAQQPAKPMVGVLYASSPAMVMHLTPMFQQALSDTGYVEGDNVTIEYRFAEGQYERLPKLVADLIRQKATVIVAPGSVPAALAAKAATTTIPILFSVGDDPAKLGLVDSLNRPGGNLTGVNFFSAELGAKCLGLLRQLLPSAARVGVLVNPKNPAHESWIKNITAAASPVGVEIDVVKASDGREIEAAFATLVQNKAQALLAPGDSLFFNRRIQLATLASRHALPSVYPLREHTEAGGLMSYGASLSEVYRQLAIYTGRILKGAKPADLPVAQTTKFELVINLNTARALGLTIPPDVLSLADEVIE
jgi:putative ABC transport system substrate-binding protein